MPNYQHDLLQEFRKIIVRRLETLDSIESKAKNPGVTIVSWIPFADPKDQKNKEVSTLIDNYLSNFQTERKFNDFLLNRSTFFPDSRDKDMSTGVYLREYSIGSFKRGNAKLKLPSEILKLKIKLKNIRAKLKKLTPEDVEETIIYLSREYLHKELMHHTNDWLNTQLQDDKKDKDELKDNLQKSLKLTREFLKLRDPEEIKRVLTNEISEGNVSLRELYDSLKKVIKKHGSIIEELKLEVENLKHDKKVKVFSGLDVATSSSSNEFEVPERVTMRNL